MEFVRSMGRALGAAAALAALAAAPALAPAPAQASSWLFGGSGGDRAAAPGDCSDGVREMQDAMREQAINDRIALAKEIYSTLPDGFSKLSCLERLLNGGMDIFFRPPSIGNLLGMLESAVCRQADDMFERATAPLNRAADAALPVGEIIPGVDLGSVSGGVNMRARGGNGGTVTTNLKSVLSGGPAHRRDAYDPREFGGGLFGN